MNPQVLFCPLAQALRKPMHALSFRVSGFHDFASRDSLSHDSWPLEHLVPKMPKRGSSLNTLHLSRFKVSRFHESGLPVSRLLASRTPSSRNAEKGLTLKCYRISQFGESQCNRSPYSLSFKSPVVEMPKCLGVRSFEVLRF